MWTYDLAREQAPTLDHLRRMLALTRESGYDAFGLYMEHRFAYPSTPWAHGTGCVTPEMVRELRLEFPDIQIVPFLNLLGHFEGFLYTEGGKRYREALFEGMQACPSCPEFLELCGRIVDDALDAFDSEIVHLGGDETWQLGQCERCKERVGGSQSAVVGRDRDSAASEAAIRDLPTANPRAYLYASHFLPLIERVSKAGRRPAIWGDMLLEHPEAMEAVPKNTLIFDWQYFGSCRESSGKLLDAGFEVVACPALHTYNAAWMHLEKSEENVRQIAADVSALGLYGLCLTTWECGLFGAYDTLFPAIRACGRTLSSGSPRGFLDEYRAESGAHEEWARLMGVELERAGRMFSLSGNRSALKCRLLLYSNPFLLWMRHGEELCGEVGDRALGLLQEAEAVAPGEAERGVTRFVKCALEFARLAESARAAYASGEIGEAIKALSICRGIFDDLERVARQTHARIGGSLADIERCKACKAHVETVIRRVKDYGDGSLGYLPAFEILTHPRFVPHDQASWWLVNTWANE